eukprot:c11378_g1_i1.p1 GENE.c11378_g1_i1~~c11378_g1_i1.p1  ORF type:complete len:799 (-),score=339.59 c11378_g1_i1:24-2420(-)
MSNLARVVPSPDVATKSPFSFLWKKDGKPLVSKLNLILAFGCVATFAIIMPLPFLGYGAEKNLDWKSFLTICVCIISLMAMVAQKKPEKVMFLAAIFFCITGVLSIAEVVAPFSQEVIFLVALLMALSAGIVQTGIAEALVSKLLGAPKSMALAQFKLVCIVCVVASLVSNITVVIVMIPIVQGWCARIGRPAEKFLQPLAIASSLGGLGTLIGTVTNLLINGELVQAQSEYKEKLAAIGQPNITFGMFEFTPVGASVCIFFAIYTVCVSGFLLSNKKSSHEHEFDFQNSDKNSISANFYSLWFSVRRKSPICGKTVNSCGLTSISGVHVVAIRTHDMKAKSSSQTTTATSSNSKPNSSTRSRGPVTPQQEEYQEDENQEGLGIETHKIPVPDIPQKIVITNQDAIASHHLCADDELHIYLTARAVPLVRNLNGIQLVGVIPRYAILGHRRRHRTLAEVVVSAQSQFIGKPLSSVVIPNSAVAIGMRKTGFHDNPPKSFVSEPETPRVDRRISFGGGAAKPEGASILLEEINVNQDHVSTESDDEENKDYEDDLRELVLAGDTLLVETVPKFYKEYAESIDFVLIKSVPNSRPPKSEKLIDKIQMVIAGVSLISFSLLAALDIINLVLVAAVIVIIMIVSKLMSSEESLAAMDTSILFTILGSFALSNAMTKTNVSKVAGELVVSAGLQLGDFPLLALVYFITGALSGIVNNSTAALLMFDICFLAALDMKTLTVKQVMTAIVMGASSSYTTPIGDITTLMVSSIAGYKFWEFLRFGYPLLVIESFVVAGATLLFVSK